MQNKEIVKIKLARKYWIILGLIFITAAAAGWLNAAHSNKSVAATSVDCNEDYRQDGFVQIGSRLVSIQSMKTDAELKQGLSGRHCLPNIQGMLFSFAKPGFYSFWAKDMNFDVDIVWLDLDKKVVSIKSHVTPQTYPERFSSSSPAQYVLEVGSGQANVLGLQTGTALKF